MEKYEITSFHNKLCHLTYFLNDTMNFTASLLLLVKKKSELSQNEAEFEISIKDVDQ